jgi:prolyl-tRNA editing enzyme YbaK/EbsC (Cys-tRNA(Pro) deacylase)
MSLESARAFLAARAPEVVVEMLERPSETMWLSAHWGVLPAQIAKALVLKLGERHAVVMACGDARLDAGKAKSVLGGKFRFLPGAEAAALTGHEVGGICPFGLAVELPVYCDVMLRRFDIVVTGGGATHAAVRIAPARMGEITAAVWADLCEGPVSATEG